MSQNSSAYKEKKWGKDVEGEYVVDGYVFRGKLRFKKALEGLKGIVKKGRNGEYRGVKYTVLDERKKGAGIEADVEVDTQKPGERGTAVLELMGPNNKKEYVVMITKYKASEAKFVTLLTEKIIKPMMSDLMLDIDINNSLEIKQRSKSAIKCVQCDKTFKSKPGLKTHVTKMHKEEEELKNTSENTQESVKTYQKKCEKCEFLVKANKRYTVAQNMIKHKEECHKSTVKSYKRMNCSKCDFETRESLVMRRHMRDEHEAGTVSTSPPPKKKRKSPVESEENGDTQSMEIEEGIEDLSFKMEDMDIDNDEDGHKVNQKSKEMDEKINLKRKNIERQETIHKIKQLETEKIKLLIEENQIKSQKEQNKKRKQKSKDERKRKNAKIRKANSTETPDKRFGNFRNIPDECRDLVDKDDIVYVVLGDGSCAPRSAAAWLFHDESLGPQLRRKMNFFMAQNWYRKYQYLTPCSEESPFVKQIKGKNISFTDPKKVIEFLKTSPEAAYMWSDSEDLVTIADMYQIRIKVITINRHDQTPTINWIYPDEDLKDVAELKNVELKDMVLLHEEESHYNLVISKNCDLALLGSISSRLAKEDIEEEPKEELAFDMQKQLKQYKEKNEQIQQKYLKCEGELRIRTEEVEKLKVEIENLKQLIELKENGEKDDLEDAKNLVRMKNKGYERVSPHQESTPKSMKSNSIHIIEEEFNCGECDFQGNEQCQLEKHINWKHKEAKCSLCNYVGGNKVILQRHMKIKHSNDDDLRKTDICSEGDLKVSDEAVLKNPKEMKHNKLENRKWYECYECDYAVTDKEQLKHHMRSEHGIMLDFKCGACGYRLIGKSELEKHIQNKHGMEKGKSTIIECRICGTPFQDKRDFMLHRKRMHQEVVAFCRNEKDGKCNFSSDQCFWKHKENNDSVNFNIECFICQNKFQSKDTMMRHRKSVHSNVVKECIKEKNNECTHGEKGCWFKHVNENIHEKINEKVSDEKTFENDESVFQKVWRENQEK